MADEGWQDSVNLLLEPVPPDAEGEDDLEKNDLLRLHEAVVAATDWTAETIIRQLDRGNINLNPAFGDHNAFERQAWGLRFEGMAHLFAGARQRCEDSNTFRTRRERALRVRHPGRQPDSASTTLAEIGGTRGIVSRLYFTGPK